MSKRKRYKCVGYRGRNLPVHRLIAELKLRRPLVKGEEVHHLDGDTSNNHPANLTVLSKRAHSFVHHYQRREAKGVQHLFELRVYLKLLGQGVEGE